MPQGKGKASKGYGKAANRRHKQSGPFARVKKSQRKLVRTSRTNSMHGKGKAARKLGSAINRNIEKIMTSRLVHAGGSLRILKAPKNVERYMKSRPKLGQKVSADVRQAEKRRQQRDARGALLTRKSQTIATVVKSRVGGETKK